MPVAVPITTEQEFPLSVQFSAPPTVVKVTPTPDGVVEVLSAATPIPLPPERLELVVRGLTPGLATVSVKALVDGVQVLDGCLVQVDAPPVPPPPPPSVAVVAGEPRPKS